MKLNRNILREIIMEQLDPAARSRGNMIYLLIYSDGYTPILSVDYAFSSMAAAQEKARELNAKFDPVSGLSYEVQQIQLDV